MPKLNNAMEVFKLLDKSNCRECNETTCLAFAAAVFQGRKQLSQCPRLGNDVIKQFGDKIEKPNSSADDMEKAVELLKREVAQKNLSAIAQKLGGRFSSGKLILKIMGKDFHNGKKTGGFIVYFHFIGPGALPGRHLDAGGQFSFQ